MCFYLKNLVHEMRSSTSSVLLNFPEFPQSCDSSIPLVAQELMRQMIRRFALEYACKSQAHEGLNGLSDSSELLPHQPDPDGPLDLTTSRASQALKGKHHKQIVFSLQETSTQSDSGV